jgi:hypothetical protein
MDVFLPIQNQRGGYATNKKQAAITEDEGSIFLRKTGEIQPSYTQSHLKRLVLESVCVFSERGNETEIELKTAEFLGLSLLLLLLSAAGHYSIFRYIGP